MIAPRATVRKATAGPPAFLALIFYLIASLVLLGKALLHSHQCSCLGTDEGIFIWAFACCPHALLDGSNPLNSDIIYAPDGFNIALGALVPGPR